MYLRGNPKEEHIFRIRREHTAFWRTVLVVAMAFAAWGAASTDTGKRVIGDVVSAAMAQELGPDLAP